MEISSNLPVNKKVPVKKQSRRQPIVTIITIVAVGAIGITAYLLSQKLNLKPTESQIISEPIIRRKDNAPLVGYKDCNDKVLGLTAKIPGNWICETSWNSSNGETINLRAPGAGQIVINHQFGEDYCYPAEINNDIKCIAQTVYDGKFKLSVKRLSSEDVPGVVSGNLIERKVNQNPSDLHTQETVQMVIDYDVYTKLDKYQLANVLDSISLSDKIYHEDFRYETRYAYLRGIKNEERYEGPYHSVVLDYVDDFVSSEKNDKCTDATYSCVSEVTDIQTAIKNVSQATHEFPIDTTGESTIDLNGHGYFSNDQSILDRWNNHVLDKIVFQVEIIAGKVIMLKALNYRGDIYGTITNLQQPSTITFVGSDGKSKTYSLANTYTIKLMKKDRSYDQGNSFTLLFNAVNNHFQDYISDKVWLNFGDDYKAEMVQNISS